MYVLIFAIRNALRALKLADTEDEQKIGHLMKGLIWKFIMEI